MHTLTNRIQFKLKPFWLERSLLTSVICLITTLASLAQIPLVSNREKVAFTRIREKKWTEARELLSIALKKDSLSIEAHYVFSIYFSSLANPKFNLDTSRIFVLKATKLFKSSELKARERLAKFPINQTVLFQLKRNIDSLAYSTAQKKNSISALNHFIKFYSGADQIKSAKFKRDSLAFDQAVRKNNAQSIKAYLSEWPESHLKDIAEEKYDELNFREQTKNKTATEFERFVLKNQNSRWYNEALKKLFMVTTLDGSENAFKIFSEKFPNNVWADLSSKINQYRKPNYSTEPWITVAENKKFGFINFQGKIIIPPKYDSVSYEISCKEASPTLITLPDGIYSRSGETLIKGHFLSAKPVGAGFILLQHQNNQYELRHESGWTPFQNYIQDAQLIANHFLAIKKENKWLLASLNSEQVLPPVYDSIYQINSTIILKKAGKFQVLKANEILPFKEGKAPIRLVDQISGLGLTYLLVDVGNMEEVLDNQLETIIRLDRHQISLTPAGFILEKNNYLQFPEWPQLVNKSITKVEFPEPWMVTYSRFGKGLYYIKDKSEAVINADSIWFNGQFAFTKKKDSVTLFTPLRQKVTFDIHDEFKFLSSSDSGLFFMVRKKTILQLFDAFSGKRVVSGAYSEINPITKEYFAVKLKNKIGLVSNGGKELLPADYDAMIYQNGWFSLLKEKRFGGYHPASKKILKPIYEANLISYSENLMLARKNKKWGILNLKQKPEKALFNYDEVKYVNDSLALVRKMKVWSMMNVYSNQILADQITDWQSVEAGERIIFKSAGLYGLLSPTLGMIIKPRFQEIIWLNDEHQSVFVGILPSNTEIISLDYFNRHGQSLQTFNTHIELLDFILCEN